MPSLVDDIAVVSEMAARELERAFLWLALAGLAAVAALAAARLLAWAARRYVDGLRRAGRIGGTALVAATCWAVVHGGIGVSCQFSFPPDTGIWDAGSYVDRGTSTLHARWGYLPAVAGYRFRWCYSYKYGQEERGPFQLPDADVSDQAADHALQIPDGEEWESVVVTCYTQYVRPPQVVTNGVYHVDGVVRTTATTNSPCPRYVTAGLTIYATVDGGGTEALTPTGGAAESLLGALSEELPDNDNEQQDQKEE